MLACASMIALAMAPVRQHAAAIERTREGRHAEAWDAASAETDPLLRAQARIGIAWSAGDLFGARRALQESRRAHPRDPLLLEWQLQLCLALRDAEGAREALDALGPVPAAELSRSAVDELEREDERASATAGLARLVSLGVFAGSLLTLVLLVRRPD